VKKTAWRAFPYPDEAFDYTGAALKKHWDRLHRGDQEPYPGAQYLTRLGKGNRALVDSIPRFDGDYAALSERVLETWRLYHRGEFAAAAESGLSLGVPGYAAANKATAMYAHYLEQSKPAKLKLFQEIATRADEARGILPDDVNSHYLYANALGRYSQGISVVEALSQGLGGKVKAALERTLALQPEHAEAHAAMGTYHAEVVSKVGGMLAGLTYGASKDQALEPERAAASAVGHRAHRARQRPAAVRQPSDDDATRNVGASRSPTWQLDVGSQVPAGGGVAANAQQLKL
jgi:hypothetical protein